MRPLLALDVDGVVAPLGSCSGLELEIGGVPLWIEEGVPARLRRLAEVFSVVWSSSWGRRASIELAPRVGLPQGLPFVSFGRRSRPGGWWKLPGLRRFAGGRALAVVDDEVGPDLLSWAAAREVATGVVEVDPRRGLGDCEVERLLEFAESLR